MAASKEVIIEGGYVVDVINESDKKKFECMLCLCIIKKATHGCRKHVFCFDCLQEYIKSNDRKEIQYCPAGCQKKFNINELSSNDPHDQLINQIECKCSFCSWKGELYGFIRVHEGKCEEKLIPCHLCSISIKRKYMDHHLKDECTHRPVACRGCQKNFPFINHLKHEESCGDIKVQCSFTNFGCNVEETRRNMITHENNSCQQHLSLIAKYFTDENKQLKEETKQLKEESKQLKDETKQLKEETKQFKEETKQFKEETQQLKEETKQLKEETKQFKEETKQLKEETKQLKEETKQLKEETKQLKEETKQLKEETKQLKEENKQLKEENKQFKEETKQLKEVTTLLKQESMEVKEESKQLKEKVELLEMNIKVLTGEVNIPQILLKEPINKFIQFPAVNEMYIKKIDILPIYELFDCFSKNNFTPIIEYLVNECDVLNNYKKELHKLFSTTETIRLSSIRDTQCYFFQITYFMDYKCEDFSLKKDGDILYIEKYNDRRMMFFISKWKIDINKGMMQIDTMNPDKRFELSRWPYLPSKYFSVWY